MPEVLSFGDKGFGDELLFHGAVVTVELACAALLFGLAMGLLSAIASLSDSRAARHAADIYATLVRGVPEFLVLLLIYFGTNILLRKFLSLFGYTGYVEVSAFAAGTVALGLVFGAFAGEVFRGAFLAVPRGQIEAALACGMSDRQVFVRIRMPQMWRFALPGLGNLWMVLLKDTSLVSVIGLDETLRWAKVAAESSGQSFTMYLAATVIYLVLTILSDVVRVRLERRASRGVRRVEA